MSDLLLVLAVAVITFASRASFLVWRPRNPDRSTRTFLELFPVGLFVSLATIGLVAPGGTLTFSPALAGGAGGVLGAVLGRRSLLATVVGGLAGYWLARLLA